MKKLRSIIQKEIFDAARSHGDQGEPEMEVGDLQDVLSHLIQNILTPEQLKTISIETSSPIESLINEQGNGNQNFHAEIFNNIPEFFPLLTPSEAMSIIFYDDSVELHEPRRGSSYSHAFAGIVHEFRPDLKLITVRDGDGEYFDVDPDEIKSISR